MIRVWTLVVAAIWLGMLLGVSFLATPAKFLAPSLILPVALDVGRHTFAVFNQVEWGLSLLLLLLAFWGSPDWIIRASTVIAVSIVVLETVWLLPLLDARVGIIIAGGEPSPSIHHALYIALEIAKGVAILVAVVAMARSTMGDRPGTSGAILRDAGQSLGRR